MWLTSTSFTTLWWSSFFRMAISLYTFSRGNMALGNMSCSEFDPWGGRRPEIRRKNRKPITTSTAEMTKTHQTFKQDVFSLTQKSTLSHQLLLWNNLHCLNKDITQMTAMTNQCVNTLTINTHIFLSFNSHSTAQNLHYKLVSPLHMNPAV